MTKSQFRFNQMRKQWKGSFKKSMMKFIDTSEAKK